jgi:hypothetical protein
LLIHAIRWWHFYNHKKPHRTNSRGSQSTVPILSQPNQRWGSLIPSSFLHTARCLLLSPPLVIATRAMPSANVALDPTSVRCLSERREPSFVHRGMVRQRHRDSQTDTQRERERERETKIFIGVFVCVPSFQGQ